MQRYQAQNVDAIRAVSKMRFSNPTLTIGPVAGELVRESRFHR
jgi:hypothetical protein